MTKSKIEKIANDIKNYLDKYYLNGDVRIYYNGKAIEHGIEDSDTTWNSKTQEFEDKESRTPWKTIYNINPNDYFNYTSDILCMSFEGSLYDHLNGYTRYDIKIYEDIQNILSKYGCYFELGNEWNLAVFEKR